MKRRYRVGMNKNGDGGKFHCEVEMLIEAENEFMATKEAERRHPELKVCYITEA